MVGRWGRSVGRSVGGAVGVWTREGESQQTVVVVVVGGRFTPVQTKVRNSETLSLIHWAVGNWSDQEPSYRDKAGGSA